MAWVVCFTTWGYVNSFGVFQTYYTGTLGESQSTISWVGSIQLWVIFFVSTFSGRALDAGLFIPTFLLGVIIQLVGIFTNSLCTRFWQLVLAQGLCTGLGSGIIFCPSMGLVTTYFHRKRALAVAIVTTGNSAGGAIYPVIVRQLLPQIGYAWTVRVLGFINLACLAAASAFMRPRLPPRKSGPILEWRAFLEVPYLCVVAGMSLVFGGLFFSYYYVSVGPNVHVWRPFCRALMPRLSTFRTREPRLTCVRPRSVPMAAPSSACLIPTRSSCSSSLTGSASPSG